jgi:hypothetical protein
MTSAPSGATEPSDGAATGARALQNGGAGQFSIGS